MTSKTNDSVLLNQVSNAVNDMYRCILEIMSLNKDLTQRLTDMENGEFGGKEVLTIDEAGFYLGYTRGYLYKLTQASAIPFHKPTGKTILFLRSELIQWVKTDGVTNINAI